MWGYPITECEFILSELSPNLKFQWSYWLRGTKRLCKNSQWHQTNEFHQFPHNQGT